MKKKFKIGVIGAGYMASSIIGSALNFKAIKKNQLLICDVNDSTLEKFSKIGVQTTKDNKYLASNCEYLFISVKPQNFAQIAGEINCCDFNKIISIMAGVKKSTIKTLLPNTLVVRCMPNAPCAVGCGVVGMDYSDLTDEKEVNFVKSIFACSSEVVPLDENLLNAVTGVGGSAPAYFYLFAKGVIEAGIKHGLSKEQATTFAVNTMLGSAKMLQNTKGKTIDQLIDSVCSKGGTTIEAIKIFNENAINDITVKAIDACVKRSIELENL